MPELHKYKGNTSAFPHFLISNHGHRVITNAQSRRQQIMSSKNRRPAVKKVTKQQTVDKPKASSKRAPKYLKVKVLRPILRPMGRSLRRGDIVDMVKETAEIRLKKGAVELYTETPLVDAIRAVQDAGGRIDYKADNQQMIKAFAELEKEVVVGQVDETPAPVEPKDVEPTEKVTGESPEDARERLAKEREKAQKKSTRKAKNPVTQLRG